MDGETMETVRDLFWGAPKSLQMVTEAMKLKDACSLEGKTGEERCFQKEPQVSIVASLAWARFVKPKRAWESCESYSKGNPEPTL